MEVVVIEKVSGEDNVAVASAENSATTQKLVKRIEKKVVHRSNIVKLGYLGCLLCKVKIFDKTRFEAFLAKSGAHVRTSCNPIISNLILKPMESFELEFISQTFPYMLDVF